MDSYRITIDTYNKIAKIYEDKFMGLDLYNDTYDTFCRLIERASPKIFEIGCGPGNITKYILNKRPDVILEAIDAAPNMLELARKNNPSASFILMDCRDIHKITPGFDGIICGFCMPYLSKQDCRKMVKDCRALLNKNGILYFSAIEGEYARSGYETGSNGQDSAYVYYHQKNYLEEILKENNFETLDLVTKTYQRANGTSEAHLIFIARKS